MSGLFLDCVLAREKLGWPTPMSLDGGLDREAAATPRSAYAPASRFILGLAILIEMVKIID